MTPIRRMSVYSALVVLFVTTLSFSLNNNQNYRAQGLNISISGTSTLHDWTLKSDKGKCDVNFVMTGDKPTGISALSFTIPVETLKSGKSAMDKNTYKAMKADEHKNVSFALVSGKVIQKDAVTYQILTIGKMTIAGTTRQMDLLATATYNPTDKSFTVSGSEKMKMTDFNVTPPTVMFGSIKTGNDITISFSSKFIK